MSKTYTQESYANTLNLPDRDGTETTITTEYKFSDGTRFVRIVTETPKGAGLGYATKTRVLRADFEGDTEHRSTRKELEAYLADADPVLYVNDAEPSRAAKREAALAQAEAENKAEAFRIEPGYEEQALPLTARQTAVLEALHADLWHSYDVLPPVKGNPVIVASATDPSGARYLIELGPEGYIERMAVRYIIAGSVGWVSLSGTNDPIMQRLMLTARAARLANPIETIGTNAAE
jgi:hypothetical protein